MMTGSSQRHGPGHGVITLGQRIITSLVNIIETRVRLAVVELEEEKAGIIHMLLMLGLVLVFTVFGLMCLLALLFLMIKSEEYRLIALMITTGTFFLLALILGFCLRRKSRLSTLLRHTKKELEADRQLLEKRSL